MASLEEARGSVGESGPAADPVSGTRMLLEALNLQQRQTPRLDEDPPSLPSRRSSLGSTVSAAALSLRLPDDLLTPSMLRQRFRRNH